MAKKRYNSNSFQNLEYLSIESITLDMEVASRCQINKNIVAKYAHNMRQGAKFPPITACFDGADFILVDGFHRIHAKKTNGDLEILASISQGNRRDAILLATNINIESSLRLTGADIDRNIHKLIGDPEWRFWHDIDIAKQCGSSDDHVFELRVERMSGFFERAAEANRSHPKQDQLIPDKLFDLESALDGDAKSFGPLISDQFLNVWIDMVIDKHIRQRQREAQFK